MPIFLLFLLIPLIEIALFVTVGGWIGLWPTLGLVLLTALTGTLLGIFVAYGFVNPLANRVKFNNASDEQFLKCIMQAVAGFAKGLAPLTAVEVARRSLDSNVQPGANELEAALKAMAPAK